MLSFALLQEWFSANEFWLVPYAAFCFLRDLFGTAEHWKWGTMAKPTPQVKIQTPNSNKSHRTCFTSNSTAAALLLLLRVSGQAAAQHV